MKTIIVEHWTVNPSDYWGYPEEMRVSLSSHPRFRAGTRWDWGFQGIALGEGYTVIVVPKGEPCPVPKFRGEV